MKILRNLCCLVAVAFLISTGCYAQSFQRGDNMVSVGMMLGSNLGSFHYNTSPPGLSLQYELGYLNMDGPGVLGLGGQLAHKSFSYNGYVGSHHYVRTWNYTIIGFRAGYHYQGFDQLKQLDPYGGLMLSYNSVNYSYSSDDGVDDPSGSYSSSMGLSGYVGARWFFTKNIAAYMEVGFGVSNLNFGGCYKF
jgi:hypothetical protein